MKRIFRVVCLLFLLWIGVYAVVHSTLSLRASYFYSPSNFLAVSSSLLRMSRYSLNDSCQGQMRFLPEALFHPHVKQALVTPQGQTTIPLPPFTAQIGNNEFITLSRRLFLNTPEDISRLKQYGWSYKEHLSSVFIYEKDDHILRYSLTWHDNRCFSKFSVDLENRKSK